MKKAVQLTGDIEGSCCPTGHTCGVGGLCWAPPGATIGVVTVDAVTITRESQTLPLTIYLTMTVDSVITAQTQVSALRVSKSPGTATVTQVVQITESSGGGGGLTTAQIGGVSGGAAALLLLVAGGVYILIRRLNVIAKFMGEQSKKAQGDGPDLANDSKGEMEAKSIVPGSRVQVNETGTQMEELSPQHGNPVFATRQRPPELSGGYEAHGISELEAPFNKRQA